jgi:hypothetical protein
MLENDETMTINGPIKGAGTDDNNKDNDED